MNDANPDAIASAVKILRAGGLVAFATETVYGLGADATNPAAIQRIYDAKGRPPTNPLIVHVCDEATARKYSARWPDAAQTLARAFWPGPLTLVVPRAHTIAPQVSAGLNTIGIRAPNHPLAQALLRAFDGPIAAPSANRSNRISPTTADHVRTELGDAVDLILDGGACPVGIESTVVDVTGIRPKVLRPGIITSDQISNLIGPVDTETAHIDSSQPAASPGQQSVHYAPRTPAFRFDCDQAERVADWCRARPNSPVAIVILDSAQSNKIGALSGNVDGRMQFFIIMRRDPVEYAHRMYATFRNVDAGNYSAIWIELPPDEPAWVAVRDRILRATRDPLWS